MSRYKVGDKVRVREWEDMANEFSVVLCGGIESKVNFVQDMKEFCGKVVTISDVNGQLYEIKEDKGAWDWTDDMFEIAEFCLNDLKDEMIVKLRNGKIYLSIGENFVGENGYMKKSEYNKSLKFQLCCLWDVVEVYPPSKEYGAGINGMLKPNAEPIWKEKKRIEIPELERTILENISDKYQWIARDENGQVYIYESKPRKNDTYWSIGGCISNIYDILNSMFQFVQWEDEEPVNFREALKGE